MKVAADLWHNGVPLEEAMQLAEKALKNPSPKGRGKDMGSGKASHKELIVSF